MFKAWCSKKTSRSTIQVPPNVVYIKKLPRAMFQPVSKNFPVWRAVWPENLKECGLRNTYWKDKGTTRRICVCTRLRIGYRKVEESLPQVSTWRGYSRRCILTYISKMCQFQGRILPVHVTPSPTYYSACHFFYSPINFEQLPYVQKPQWGGGRRQMNRIKNEKRRVAINIYVFSFNVVAYLPA